MDNGADKPNNARYDLLDESGECTISVRNPLNTPNTLGQFINAGFAAESFDKTGFVFSLNWGYERVTKALRGIIPKAFSHNNPSSVSWLLMCRTGGRNKIQLYTGAIPPTVSDIARVRGISATKTSVSFSSILFGMKNQFYANIDSILTCLSANCTCPKSNTGCLSTSSRSWSVYLMCALTFTHERPVLMKRNISNISQSDEEDSSAEVASGLMDVDPTDDDDGERETKRVRTAGMCQ